MLKASLILLLLFSVGCQTKPPVNNKQARLHMRLGTTQLQQGNYPAALKNLLLAEKSLPENAILQNNLGLAYYVRDKFELAEKHVKKAVFLDPKYTEARNNLGRIYIQLGKYDEAIKELKIAVRDLTFEKPENSFSNLGIAYFNKKQYKTSFKLLKKSLKIRRKHCQTYTYYGRSLYELKRYQLSADALQNAITTCEGVDDEAAKYYGALSQLKIGNEVQAKAILEEIKALSSDEKYQKRASKILTLLKKAENQ